MKNNMLANYCKYNNSQDVSNFLSNNLDLDVTDDCAMCFKLALKNNNTKIMSLLLEYYEKQNLTGDENSLQYKLARHNLQNALENALQFYTANEQMYQIMSKYLPINKSSNDESDNEVFDELPQVYDNIVLYDCEEQNQKDTNIKNTSELSLAGNISQIIDY